MKQIYRWLMTIVVLIVFVCTTGATTQNQLASRPDVNQFITMMVNNYGFNRAQLVTLFNQVELKPSIVNSMAVTKEQLPWYKYRAIFITPKRINEGVDFWHQHEKTINTVAKQDGVDPSVVVAILGVETFYGKIQGKFRVMDSLSTLAFDYPTRAKFFQNELKEYLLLTRENHINPLSLYGSYAGAMGQLQFMPSAYRMYAVDFQHKGMKDLQNNVDDVIASTSNYLKQNGWQRGEPIANLATVTGQNYTKLNAGLKPQWTLSELANYHIQPTGKYPANTKATLLTLAMSDTDNQYWLGFHNFYVISRYNPRVNYAMAVYQLSQAIEAARTQKAK